MRLIIDQSLAVGFIPINTRKQRASLPFASSVLERKVYNNDNITFFSVFVFTKPLCDNVLQLSPLPGSRCNKLSHSGLANVYTQKRMFYLFNELSQAHYIKPESRNHQLTNS